MARKKTPTPSVGSPTPEGEKPSVKRPRPRDTGEGYGSNPWDRREGESFAQWRAFQAYRDLGPDRSLDQVSDQIRSTVRKEHTRATFGRVGQWSRANDWVDRAAAWDDHLDSIKQEAIRRQTARDAIAWSERKRKMRERAWEGFELLWDGTLKSWRDGKPISAMDAKSLAVATEKFLAVAEKAGYGLPSEEAKTALDALPPHLAAEFQAFLVMKLSQQEGEPEQEA